MMIVVVIVVMSIIGLTLVIVAVGIARSYDNSDLGIRWRGKQSEKPTNGQDQEKSLLHVISAIRTIR